MPATPVRPVRPALAATLAVLFPGAGHYYLGEHANGAWFTTTVPLLVGGAFAVDHLTDSEDLGRHFMLTVGISLYMYQVFDAYRDARLMLNNRGYKNAVDPSTYSDLLTSPFNPDVLLQWKMVIPTTVFVVATVALNYVQARMTDGRRSLVSPYREDRLLGQDVNPYAAFALGTVANAVKYIHVGLGEEALFRGFVQSALTEWWGPWAAVPCQSVLFSLYHFPSYGADYAAYIQAFLAGLMLGWQYHSTGDLRVPTATHFFIDFIGGVTAHFMDPDRNPIGLQFGLAY